MLIFKTVIAVIDIMMAALILNVSLRERKKEYTGIGGTITAMIIVTMILMFV